MALNSSLAQPNREHLDNALLEILRGLIAQENTVSGDVKAEEVEE